ncbi:MAG: glycosyltransferase family 87 protein [Candidatus Omnitrophota bacterium]|nr:glycosyltransferase family 87 protein [Candidatus Omnitrophota bacterium]
MDLKTKTFCYLVIIFLVLRYLYFIGVVTQNGIAGDLDFFKYQRSAYAIINIKNDTPEEEIYRALHKDNEYTAYFPLFYIGLIPLYKMGNHVASIIWTLFNQLILLISIYFIIKAIKAKLSLITITLLVFMVTNFLPLEFNTASGQTNFLMLLSFSGCLYFLGKEKDCLAGIFLTLSILLKWFPIIFLIFLAWKKRYLSAVTCLFFIIVMFLLSIGCFGWKLHYIQLARIIPDNIHEFEGFLTNHSLASNFQRLFRMDFPESRGIMHFPLLANVFSIATVLIFVFLTAKRLITFGRGIKASFPFEFAFSMCLILLIPSWLHIFHLTLAIIPLLIVFLNIEKIKPQIWIFISSFILLGLEYWPDGLAIFRQGWGLLFLSGRTVGLVLLWLGYYLMLSRMSGLAVEEG